MRIKIALRVFSALTIGLILSIYINTYNYNSYNKTIRHVQTVDFNILSSVLPTSLSLMLEKGDDEHIQDMLGSNFGLFGIYVTDCLLNRGEHCHEERITYSNAVDGTQGEDDIREVLKESEFNIIWSKYPNRAEWNYMSPYGDQPVYNDVTDGGDILGRVYYVRRVPDSFIETYIGWLNNPLRGGVWRYYLLTTISSLSFFLVLALMLEYYLYVKRMRELKIKEMQREITILSTEKTDIEHKSDYLEEKIDEWKARYETLKNSSAKSEEELYSLTEELMDEHGREKQRLLDEGRQKEALLKQKTRRVDELLEKLDSKQEDYDVQHESFGSRDKLRKSLKAVLPNLYFHNNALDGLIKSVPVSDVKTLRQVSRMLVALDTTDNIGKVKAEYQGVTLNGNKHGLNRLRKGNSRIYYYCNEGQDRANKSKDSNAEVVEITYYKKVQGYPKNLDKIKPRKI